MYAMCNKSRSRAMTLVEILVAVALFAVFTLTLTQLLMGGMRTYRRGQVISTMRNDIKNALEVFSADMASATSISGLSKDANSLSVEITSVKQDLVFSGSARPTNSKSVTVAYELDVDDGVLLRTETPDGGGDALVSVLARNLVVDSTPGNSESYFVLTSDGTKELNPYMAVTLRLSALSYVGSEEQRVSMVTGVALPKGCDAGTWSSTVDSRAVDCVPIVKLNQPEDWFTRNGTVATSLERPLERGFRRVR